MAALRALREEGLARARQHFGSSLLRRCWTRWCAFASASNWKDRSDGSLQELMGDSLVALAGSRVSERSALAMRGHAAGDQSLLQILED